MIFWWIDGFCRAFHTAPINHIKSFNTDTFILPIHLIIFTNALTGIVPENCSFFTSNTPIIHIEETRVTDALIILIAGIYITNRVTSHTLGVVGGAWKTLCAFVSDQEKSLSTGTSSQSDWILLFLWAFRYALTIGSNLIAIKTGYRNTFSIFTLKTQGTSILANILKQVMITRASSAINDRKDQITNRNELDHDSVNWTNNQGKSLINCRSNVDRLSTTYKEWINAYDVGSELMDAMGGYSYLRPRSYVILINDAISIQ